MKLPRWLVMAMISLSVLLASMTAAWWWLTWPARTAQEYVELMAAGKRNEAERLMRPTETIIPTWLDLEVIARPPNWKDEIQSEARTFWDIITGRQVFKLLSGHSLVVQHGKIERPASIWLFVDTVELTDIGDVLITTNPAWDGATPTLQFNAARWSDGAWKPEETSPAQDQE